jgi:hypothetical protein
MACTLASGTGPGCDPSQGGYPTGGCIYPTGVAAANLVGSVNNQVNGGFEWDCDGAMAMIDPVHVYKGPKQPNILTSYPQYNIPVGQPYDGVIDHNNTYPYVLAACPFFKTGMNPLVLHNPLIDAPGGPRLVPSG